MKRIVLFFILIFFISSCSISPETTEISWIDTHVHPVGNAAGVSSPSEIPTCFTQECFDETLSIFDSYSIGSSIFMSPPSSVPEGESVENNLISSIEQYEDDGRFFYLAGGGSLNPLIHTYKAEEVDEATKETFRAKAEGLLANGAKGFGEMSILHVSLGETHQFEETQADHPLFLLLADIAAEHQVPIDIHMDIVKEDMETPEELLEKSSNNPERLTGNVEGFKRLLAHNREANIVLAHASSDTLGDVDVEFLRELLEENENLYLQMRMEPNPENNLDMPLDDQNKLRRDWVELFEDYPERFILGTDTFYGNPQTHVLQRTQDFLQQLPEDLAQKIACENANNIYSLGLVC